MDDAAWIRQQIEDLTLAHESRRATPWAVGDAPPDFTAAQIRAIVGVEIAVTRSEGKWKMSQNRPMADRIGVVAGYRQQGPAGDIMADVVAERGEVPKA